MLLSPRRLRAATASWSAVHSPALSIITARFQRAQQAAPRCLRKKCSVIRLKVPLDVHAVIANRSFVFARATPLRVETLVAMAVQEASGSRAPHDRVARMLQSTLRGFAEGSFVVEIDGRVYRRPGDVAVCSGTVCIRFFTCDVRVRTVHRPQLFTR